MDRAGRSGGHAVDREPQLGAGRQPNADAGQRRPAAHVALLQDHLRAAQHRQRLAGHRLPMRHGRLSFILKALWILL